MEISNFDKSRSILLCFCYNKEYCVLNRVKKYIKKYRKPFVFLNICLNLQRNTKMAMRLKVVIKLGTIVTVVLFCLAIGYYAFMKLEDTGREREMNLFSLVPSDCVAVLESNDVNGFLNDYPMLNYGDMLNDIHFPGLLQFMLKELNEYTKESVHGLSSRMNRLMVSFHDSSSFEEHVIYFGMNADDKKVMMDLLRSCGYDIFLPKQEKYRGEVIDIYPLGSGDFLATYSKSGFMVMSYQKRLIEKVIDAGLDGTSLNDDESFSQILKKKKTKTYFTLYGHSSSVPFLKLGTACWYEYDFQMNSDVLYLTGGTFFPDSMGYEEMVMDNIRCAGVVKEEGLVISADRDSTVLYANLAFDAHERGGRTLFDECVANLSHEADFALVTDMQKVAEEPDKLKPYLPSFILQNIHTFRRFILSTQFSLQGGRLSQMWVFTYKD